MPSPPLAGAVHVPSPSDTGVTVPSTHQLPFAERLQQAPRHLGGALLSGVREDDRPREAGSVDPEHPPRIRSRAEDLDSPLAGQTQESPGQRSRSLASKRGRKGSRSRRRRALPSDRRSSLEPPQKVEEAFPVVKGVLDVGRSEGGRVGVGSLPAWPKGSDRWPSTVRRPRERQDGRASLTRRSRGQVREAAPALRALELPWPPAGR